MMETNECVKEVGRGTFVLWLNAHIDTAKECSPTVYHKNKNNNKCHLDNIYDHLAMNNKNLKIMATFEIHQS